MIARNAARLAVTLALVAAPAGLFAADAGEEVRFTTEDGLSIAATWYPPPAGALDPPAAVVALPMYGRTRDTYAPFVAHLAARGIGLLAVDLRGHGDSAKQGDADLAARVTARDPELFRAMHADAEAAVAFLAREKKIPAGRTALLGASVGASVAIDEAVRHPKTVGAVACLSPGTNYLGVASLEHVKSWPGGLPLLLVTSRDEEPAGAGRLLAALAEKGAEERVVADGGRPGTTAPFHGTEMFERAVDMERNLADWLAREIAFHRIDFGGGLTARVGSLGSELYVGVDAPGARAGAETEAVLRLGVGPVTDPWSKTETLRVGLASVTATRFRARLSLASLPVEAGRPFAVAVSLDGSDALPSASAPPLFVTLR